MKVILEINGWRKVDNIDDSSFHNGVVNVTVMPPVNWLVPPNRTTMPRREEYPIVKLIHLGKYQNGIPVFSFE